MKRLLEELKFQIDMLEQGTIDETDFISVMTEIHEHYNYSYFENDGKPKYSRYGIEMVEWFKKS